MNYMKLMKMYFDFYDTFRRKIIQRSSRKLCRSRISGKVELTEEQKQQIKDFYKPYGKVTTIYHQMYYEKTGHFSEKYLPVDLYVNVIDEYFNNRQEAKYLDNKCYYRTTFSGIKQPENALYRIGGFWFDTDMNLINLEKVYEILAKEKALFLKEATESYGGLGVAYISKDTADMAEQFDAFVKRVKGDIVAQRPIVQHDDLSKVNESSVNTIRMISLLTESGPKTYSSIFRVGSKGKKVDNYTSGGLTVGIGEDGRLNKYAYNAKGERFEKHPSNDFVFEGYQIPCYQEARKLVERAHLLIPHFRLVSFDVAIEKDGTPVLIEANFCKGSAEIHEFNNGPLFGDDTKKILDEVFGKK